MKWKKLLICKTTKICKTFTPCSTAPRCHLHLHQKIPQTQVQKTVIYTDDTIITILNSTIWRTHYITLHYYLFSSQKSSRIIWSTHGVCRGCLWWQFGKQLCTKLKHWIEKCLNEKRGRFLLFRSTWPSMKITVTWE